MDADQIIEMRYNEEWKSDLPTKLPAFLQKEYL